ncbi:MAG: 3'-5' exonuclease [Nannocystaceae bacterium]
MRAKSQAKKVYERLVILDFEATCQQGKAPDPQEIIEFPSVLIDVPGGRVVDEFSTFVRPVHHPQLSEFCTELTSIRSEDVADAPTFTAALDAHLAWLEGHGLVGGDDPGVIVTCGDWDLAVMLPAQCATSGRSVAELPAIYRRWINIKPIFGKHRRGARAYGMKSMLRNLGLTLEGRHHRGIDDCRNIARIAAALHALGAEFRVTSELPPSRYPEIEVVLCHGEVRHRAILKKRATGTILGLASGLFRRQIVEVRTPAGALVGDAELTELRSGAELVAIARGEHRQARARARQADAGADEGPADA